MKILILMTFSLLLVPQTKADVLSPEALYYRCYAHLTRSRPAANDARLAAVKSGSLNYVDACMQVFDLAKLDGSSNQLAVNTPEAVKVLENFNRFHVSWFGNVDVGSTIVSALNVNHLLHDGTESALHFTRAVFHPDGLYKDAITSDVTYSAIRSKGYNTYAVYPFIKTGAPLIGTHDVSIYVGGGTNKVDTPLSSVLDSDGTQNGYHIQLGKIIGVEPMKHVLVNDKRVFDAVNWPRPSAGSPINVTRSFGAGAIGTQGYILINKLRAEKVTDDGGIGTGRVWSKTVFQEILCRELPVVQPKDAIALVDQTGTNSFPFRNASSCMQCHSSIDPMAWTTRNLRMNRIGESKDIRNTLYFLEKYQQTLLPQETGPVHGLGATNSPDANFYKRPAKGHFYFRTYDGKLISEPLDGLSGAHGLGEEIANTDDYYACASKRYFEFFTGHKAIIEDITDPNSKKLNQKELKLRNFTIALGQKLKQTQKMRDVVKEIIASDYYKSSDYDIKF